MIHFIKTRQEHVHRLVSPVTQIIALVALCVSEHRIGETAWKLKKQKWSKR